MTEYQLIEGPEHGWSWAAIEHIRKMADAARFIADLDRVVFRDAGVDVVLDPTPFDQFEAALLEWIQLEQMAGRDPFAQPVRFTDKLDAATAAAGKSADVLMEHPDFPGGPYRPSYAAAVIAKTVEEAAEFGAELLEVTRKKFPAWRGWGLEYPGA